MDPTTSNANATQLVIVNSQLDTVIGALSRLSAVFPLASYQLGKAEQSRAEANAGSLPMSASVISSGMGASCGPVSGTTGAGIGF